jgi:hypothetical protein
MGLFTRFQTVVDDVGLGSGRQYLWLMKNNENNSNVLCIRNAILNITAADEFF